MKNRIMQFFKEEKGQAMTEYGLIIALVAVVLIASIAAIGSALGVEFDKITAILSGTES